MDQQRRILALVIAGGKGSRLYPLTRDRAKPAVPFGGCYRIIDFVLSNLYNSGFRSIYVLTQYKAQSLVEHVQRTWGSRSGHSDFVTIVPAQMRMGERWYRGTSDAVWQNFHLVEDYRADPVLVFGADHVYKMNVRQMVDYHRAKEAVATVACLPVPVEDASQYGIVEIDSDSRIVGFQEKPQTGATTIPGDPTRCFASMGNYIFASKPLAQALYEDTKTNSHHDFGRDIVPAMVKTRRVFAYDFARNRIPGVSDTGEHGYWRDVGTLDAYFEACMDLKNPLPHFNLYNWEWPILSANYPDPPSKVVLDKGGKSNGIVQTIMSSGCVIIGSSVKDCVLGRNVWIEEGADVRDSILLDNVYVGKNARIQRAIIDKNVRVADGDHIGHDLARDAIRHHVSPSGVTVVAKARESWATRSRDL
jgi:glucose-1-phosphate adenylyltransferase